MNRRIIALSAIASALIFAGCTKQSSIVGPPSGSASWTQVNGLTGFYNIVASGSDLYAAGNYGVFRSTDNGSNWVVTDSSLASGDYTVAAVNGNLFIGDYNNQTGIMKSTDGGATWTECNSGLATAFSGVYQNVYCIKAVDSVIFAGTSSNGIFKSTDNGTTWTAANQGISYGTTVFSLVTSGPNIIAGTQSGMYLSSNNGESWIANDSGLVNMSPYYSGAPYVTSLAAVGSNVYAGAVGSQLFLSENNGVSWIYISNGVPGSGQSGVGVAAVDSNVVLVDDNGVFTTTNYGVSWKNITGNLPSASLSAFDEANGYLYVQLSNGSVWRMRI